jgi:hypothetical protein
MLITYATQFSKLTFTRSNIHRWFKLMTIVMQPKGIDIIHEAYMYFKGYAQEFYDAQDV